MSTAQSWGAGDNLFRSIFLLPLLQGKYDKEYEKLSYSFIVRYTRSISDLQQDNHPIWARVYALAMPLVAAFSVVQFSMVTLHDAIGLLDGHPRKEYVIINTGDSKACELREVSLGDDLRELARHVALLFATLICYIPGLFASGIYCRENSVVLPDEKSQQELKAKHEENLASEKTALEKNLNAKHQREIDRLKGENKGEFERKEQELNKKHAEELEKAKQALETKHQEAIKSLEEKQASGRAQQKQELETEHGKNLASEKTALEKTLNAKHQEEIDRLKGENKREFERKEQELETKHAEELEKAKQALETKHQEAITNLEEKQASALARQEQELETKHAEELEKAKQALETKHQEAIKSLEEKQASALARQEQELKAKHGEKLERAKQELETKHAEELEKATQTLKGEHEEEIKGLENTYQQTLEATKQELEKKRAEELASATQALIKEREQVKLDTIFAMLPVLTSHNLQEMENLFRSNSELNGLTLSVVTEESCGKEGKEVGKYGQESWGITDSQKLSAKDAVYEPVPLRNKAQFLEPLGTIELKVDCNKLDHRYLALILNTPHLVHRLVLIKPDMDIVLSAEKEGLLSKIHSLVIQDDDALECGVIDQIAEKFKTIACFDLRGATLKGVLSDGLLKGHIICWKEKDNIKRPSSVSFKEMDNIEEQFNDLNKNILFKMVKEFERGTSDRYTYFAYYFPSLNEGKLCHPAAPFVTKLCCFNGVEIGSSHLKLLMPRLAQTFPHLRVLDFSGCKLLDSEALVHIRSYPVLNLYLDGCEGIFYRQIKEEGIFKYQNDPGYLYQNQRYYILDSPSTMKSFMFLFNHGTKSIRIKDMGCLLKDYKTTKVQVTTRVYPGVLAQRALNTKNNSLDNATNKGKQENLLHYDVIKGDFQTLLSPDMPNWKSCFLLEADGSHRLMVNILYN